MNYCQLTALILCKFNGPCHCRKEVSVIIRYSANSLSMPSNRSASCCNTATMCNICSRTHRRQYRSLRRNLKSLNFWRKNIIDEGPAAWTRTRTAIPSVWNLCAPNTIIGKFRLVWCKSRLLSLKCSRSSSCQTCYRQQAHPQNNGGYLQRSAMTLRNDPQHVAVGMPCSGSFRGPLKGRTHHWFHSMGLEAKSTYLTIQQHTFSVPVFLGHLHAAALAQNSCSIGTPEGSCFS